MTLVVAVKGPEGLALAADSRITAAVDLADGRRDITYFDNATKLFSIASQPYIGVLAHGTHFLGGRLIGGFMPDFEAQLAGGGTTRLKVADVAGEVSQFYAEHWRNSATASDIYPLLLLVAGFDEGDAQGRIYQVSVPNAVTPVEHLVNEFGASWGGETGLVSRLFGVDTQAIAVAKNELSLRDNQVRRLEAKWRDELTLRVPYQALPLQDCVDLGVYMVTMTSVAQSFTYGRNRDVGGAVDVATITRTQGFRIVRQKQIEVRPPFSSSPGGELDRADEDTD